MFNTNFIVKETPPSDAEVSNKMSKFPHYAIHNDTKYIIAGFVDQRDAEKFCVMFSHKEYVVRDLRDVASFHNVAL